MDDVRMNTRLADHPKTLKLERRLGPAGCWAFVKLLLWVGDSRPDGNLAGLSDEDLELAVRWAGPVPLVPVLGEVGFLDGSSGNYQVHDWGFHQPFVSTRKVRVEKAKAAARARWDKSTPEDRAAVGRLMVDARRTRQEGPATAEQEDTTSEQRAESKLGDMPKTYPGHIDIVPSTHAPTHPPTPGRTTRDVCPENGHAAALHDCGGLDASLPKVVATLSYRELKGLKKTLERTCADRRIHPRFRDQMRQRLLEVTALMQSTGATQ